MGCEVRAMPQGMLAADEHGAMLLPVVAVCFRLSAAQECDSLSEACLPARRMTDQSQTPAVHMHGIL